MRFGVQWLGVVRLAGRNGYLRKRPNLKSRERVLGSISVNAQSDQEAPARSLTTGRLRAQNHVDRSSPFELEGYVEPKILRV